MKKLMHSTWIWTFLQFCICYFPHVVTDETEVQKALGI